MKSKYLLLLLMLICSGLTFAQKKEIKGKVIDQSTGEPLAGVSIISNKSKGAVLTKADGSFELSLDKSASTLVFTYVGYAPQSKTVSGSTSLTIALVPEAVSKAEVVVIGYGTQKKSS